MDHEQSVIFVPGRGPSPGPLRIGGKGHNLAILAELGQPVPPFFCVTTDAFRRGLGDSGLLADMERRLHGLDASDLSKVRAEAESIQQAICTSALSPGLVNAVREHLRQIGGDGAPVAVRSSAADEDAATDSFAGIHESYLFVHGEQAVLDAIRNVWASAFSERALAYRLTRGLPPARAAVAVVVQRMVDPLASGVLFTIDPVSGDTQRTVVSALWGTGEGLVTAGFNADLISVAKSDSAITRELADKDRMLVFNRTTGQGVCEEAVPAARRNEPCLTDDQIRAIAQAGSAIENHYGRPQDIEFALGRDGKLYVLQARPVTTAKEYGPAAGQRLIWDNSNIIESYSGVTTPMTFSFIRRAYAIVYHCFCEVMGVAAKDIEANTQTYANMLGLIRGEVFYNIRNWYRVVRLFPGYNYNRTFMESMMGVKESLDEPLPERTAWQKWTVDLAALLRLLGRTFRNFVRIQKDVDAFQRHFSDVFGRWLKLDLDRLKPHLSLIHISEPTRPY